MFDETMLDGRGVARMLGRRGESVRKVRPRARVRSEGVGWSELPLLPGLGVSGRTSRGSDGEDRGAEDVNQRSVSGSGRTWASDRVGGLAARIGTAREVRHGCTWRLRRREVVVSAGSLRMGMLVIYAFLTFLWEILFEMQRWRSRASYVPRGCKVLYNALGAAPKWSEERGRFGRGDVTRTISA